MTIKGDKTAELLGDGKLLLASELTQVALRRHFAHFLEDQLANPHAGMEADDPRTQVEDLELNGQERFVGFGAEAGVDGRCGDMDPQADPGKAALPLDARGDAGF